VRASSCTVAQQVHPVTGDAARRCRRGEVRHSALTPASRQAQVEARLAHINLLTRRRRAQGHGLPTSSSSSRVATCAARLASDQVQSTRWCARATAVPKHARPRLACSARQSGNHNHSTRRRGGAHHPLQENSRVDVRFTHEVLARRRRAQGHEWPRSTTLSRGSSPAARWPALRQVHMAAHLNTASSTQSRDQRGREVKKAAVALRLGRWCSCGRHGEDGRRGVVVHGIDVPASLLPPCVDAPVGSLISSKDNV
jgi:hypothetical protein